MSICLSPCAQTNLLVSIGEQIRTYPTPESQGWFKYYSDITSSLDLESAHKILADSKKWIFVILNQEGGAAAISKDDVYIIAWDRDGHCYRYSGQNWIQKKEVNPKHSEILKSRHHLLRKIKHKYHLEVHESICGFDTCFICFGDNSSFEVFASNTVYMPAICHYFLNGKADELTEYMREPNYRRDKNSMTLYEQLIFLGTFEAIKTYAFDYETTESQAERIEYFEGLSWPVSIDDWENKLNQKWNHDLPESQITKPEPAKIDSAEIEQIRKLLKQMEAGK